jgi:hypothetical protein
MHPHAKARGSATGGIFITRGSGKQTGNLAWRVKYKNIQKTNKLRGP